MDNMVKLSSSWLVQETDIFQRDEQDFSLKIDMKNCIGVGAWVKSRQLPYCNLENFDPS